jgi:hypothetical protein
MCEPCDAHDHLAPEWEGRRLSEPAIGNRHPFGECTMTTKPNTQAKPDKPKAATAKAKTVPISGGTQTH